MDLLYHYHMAASIVALRACEAAHARRRSLEDLRLAIEPKVEHAPDEVGRDPPPRKRNLGQTPRQAVALPLRLARDGFSGIRNIAPGSQARRWPGFMPRPRIRRRIRD